MGRDTLEQFTLFDMNEEDYNFWRLMYALKWQAEVYDDSMSKPMLDLYAKHFEKQGYENPMAEAQTLITIVDGVVTMILLKGENYDRQAIKECILNKYRK